MNRMIFAALLVACAGPVVAQESSDAPAAGCRQQMRLDTYALNDAGAVLARALDVAGYLDEGASGIFKSSVRSMPVCVDSIPFLQRWAQPVERRLIEPAPVSVEITGNSAYPRDRNNGPVWNGVGVNAQVNTGILVQRGPLSFGFLPILTSQQNSWYEHGSVQRTNRSQYANPNHLNIDLPRRFGSDAFTGFYPGQSFMRADFGPVSLAFSTENLWFGAMQIHPIILSNTAAGFPHVRIGTPKGIDLKVVNIEAQIFIGELQESKFFDGDESNDAHVFGGSLLTIEPKFVPGLHLGIARIYHDLQSFSEMDLGDYAGRIVSTPFYASGNLVTENAIGALFLRWKNPESGFEVYGEWTREDTPLDLTALIRDGDWSQAWAIGVQKTIVSPERLTRIYGEVLHLGESSAGARGGNGSFSYYTHSRVTQGHTNRGQLLGASVGPGGNTRAIGVDVFSGASRTSFEFEHTRYDEDAYYRTWARRWGSSRHDTELTGELRRAQLFGDFQVEGTVRYSHRWDRDFLSARLDLPESITESNWGTELRVRWVPSFRTTPTGAN